MLIFRSQPARLSALAGLAALTAFGFSATAVFANDKANEITQRFALEAEAAARKAQADAAAAELRKKKADEAKRVADARRAAAKAKALEAERQAASLKADEIEMLARARTELAELQAAEADADAMAQKATEDLKRAEAERLRINADAEQKAEAEARARVAANKAAEVAAAEDAAKAVAIADAKAAADAKARADADAKLIADAKATADAKARADADAKFIADAKAAADAKARADAEDDVEARSRRLADKLARQQTARTAPPETQSSPPVPVVTQLPSAPLSGRSALGIPQQPGPIAPAARTFGPTRVTVLLMMVAGDRGIRRTNPTADPVLCVGDSCFISRGAGDEALSMPRHKAFGTINTLGPRALACNNQLVCVFRNVDLGRVESEIQPIDLRIVRHDRREVSVAAPDGTCRMSVGRLVCGNPIVKNDYRAWIVPEGVAEEAGPDALTKALADGLRDDVCKAESETGWRILPITR
jgi:hypothetical protein